MGKEASVSKKETLVQYAVYGGIVLIIAVIMAVNREIFAQENAKAVFSILSDCFVVPGVFVTGFGAMSWVSSKGGYDAFGYIFSRFSLPTLVPTKQTTKKAETLYEYKQQKDEKGRKWTPPMLVTGLIALALGALFLGIYSLL